MSSEIPVFKLLLILLIVASCRVFLKIHSSALSNGPCHRPTWNLPTTPSYHRPLLRRSGRRLSEAPTFAPASRSSALGDSRHAHWCTRLRVGGVHALGVGRWSPLLRVAPLRVASLLVHAQLPLDQVLCRHSFCSVRTLMNDVI